MSKPTDIPTPWVEPDIMIKEVKKRIMKAVRTLTKEYRGIERIRPAIEKEIEMFSKYRTYKYPNLLEVT